ncbi:hypothetical protein HY745_03430 [Candidatus Desantisbacteria bacterium]|nr:hypothetical protein [Candidatus Desantisbacteria bacterium]
MLDAILGFKVNSSLRINFGQFFIPFSQENLNSNTKLETINRSQVVEALAARGKDVIGNQNGRDVGIQAGGNILIGEGFGPIDYAFGVFNGSGTNKPDLNNRKDLVGRLVFHPLKEISIGGSYYNGSYTLSSALTKKATRIRSGAEIAFVKEDISIKGEYIKGKDDIINRDGWYIQTGYFFIPKTFQGVLKYDSYDPNTNGKDKVQKDETDVYTYGVNWYFNKWAFLQINYERKDEKVKNIKNNAFIGQVTLQF